MDYEKVYEQMLAGEDEKALRSLAKSLMPDCLRLIESRSCYKGHEATNIYYHAYMYVKSKIIKKNFLFKGDNSFRSYFKTACIIISREFMRLDEKPNVVPFPEEWLNLPMDDEEQYAILRHETYQRKNELYGIDLSTDDTNDELLPSVVRMFHQLNEKCKFLIILKYFLHLSHFDIVESLHLFYEIRSEDVSKSELSRCLRNIRTGLRNQEGMVI